MPEVNVPLLRKAVEWAEAEAAKPESLCEWDQSAWVLPLDANEELVGLNKLTIVEQAHVMANNTIARMHKDPDCGTCYCIAGKVVHEVDGAIDLKTVEKRAADLLGLTNVQAQRLFMGTNSIQQIRRVAEQLAGERL